MEATRAKDSALAAEWSPPRDRRWTRDDARRMAAALKASGGKVIPFAKKHGINEQRVRWWLDRLAERKSPTFLPVRVVGNDEGEARASHGAAAEVEVVVGAASIRVRSGFEPTLLRKVVAALAVRPC